MPSSILGEDCGGQSSRLAHTPRGAEALADMRAKAADANPARTPGPAQTETRSGSEIPRHISRLVSTKAPPAMGGRPTPLRQERSNPLKCDESRDAGRYKRVLTWRWPASARSWTLCHIITRVGAPGVIVIEYAAVDERGRVPIFDAQTGAPLRAWLHCTSIGRRAALCTSLASPAPSAGDVLRFAQPPAMREMCTSRGKGLRRGGLASA